MDFFLEKNRLQERARDDVIDQLFSPIKVTGWQNKRLKAPAESKLDRDSSYKLARFAKVFCSDRAPNYCSEESPLRPISQYAKEKVEIEKELMEHPNAISFRLATVFGMSPRMRVDLLVNDFTHRAVYDRFVVLFESHFKRNYIHVRDVSRVFQHALQCCDKMVGQIYNVGLSDSNISKKELCEYIQKQLPEFIFSEAPVGKDPDQRNYIVSNEKIEATGFKTEFSLERGINELIKGYTMIRNTQYGNV